MKLDLRRIPITTPTKPAPRLGHKRSDHQSGIAIVVALKLRGLEKAITITAVTAMMAGLHRLGAALHSLLFKLVCLVITTLLLASCGDGPTDYHTVGQNSTTGSKTPVTLTCNAAQGGFFCPTRTNWGFVDFIREFIQNLVIGIASFVGNLTIAILTWLLQSAQSVRFNYTDNRVCPAPPAPPSPGTTPPFVGVTLEPLAHCAVQLYDILKFAPFALWAIPFFAIILQLQVSEIFPAVGETHLGKFFVRLAGVCGLSLILDGLVTIVIDVPFRIFLWILTVDGTSLSHPGFGFETASTVDVTTAALNKLADLFTVNPNIVRGDLIYVIILSVVAFLTSIPLLCIGLYFLARALTLIVWFCFGPLAVTSLLLPQTSSFFEQWSGRLISMSVSILPSAVIFRLAIILDTSVKDGGFSSDPFQFILIEVAMLILFGIGGIICFKLFVGEVRHIREAVRVGRSAAKFALTGGGTFSAGARGAGGAVRGAVRAVTAERFKLKEGNGADEVTIKRRPWTRLKNKTFGLRQEQAQELIGRDAKRREVTRYTKRPVATAANVEYDLTQTRSMAAMASSMQDVGVKMGQFMRQQAAPRPMYQERRAVAPLVQVSVGVSGGPGPMRYAGGNGTGGSLVAAAPAPGFGGGAGPVGNATGNNTTTYYVVGGGGGNGNSSSSTTSNLPRKVLRQVGQVGTPIDDPNNNGSIATANSSRNKTGNSSSSSGNQRKANGRSNSNSNSSNNSSSSTMQSVSPVIKPIKPNPVNGAMAAGSVPPTSAQLNKPGAATTAAAAANLVSSNGNNGGTLEVTPVVLLQSSPILQPTPPTIRFYRTKEAASANSTATPSATGNTPYPYQPLGNNNNNGGEEVVAAAAGNPNPGDNAALSNNGQPKYRTPYSFAPRSKKSRNIGRVTNTTTTPPLSSVNAAVSNDSHLQSQPRPNAGTSDNNNGWGTTIPATVTPNATPVSGSRQGQGQGQGQGQAATNDIVIYRPDLGGWVGLAESRNYNADHAYAGRSNASASTVVNNNNINPSTGRPMDLTQIRSGGSRSSSAKVANETKNGPVTSNASGGKKGEAVAGQMIEEILPIHSMPTQRIN